MKYYAAVDEDGTKLVYESKPKRNRDKKRWRGFAVISGLDSLGFPEDLTWADAPVEVLIELKVVK